MICLRASSAWISSLQLVDLGDLLVELADLALQEAGCGHCCVADLLGVVAVHREPTHQHADDRGAGGDGGEMLPGALAPLRAVRQQVDAGSRIHF